MTSTEPGQRGEATALAPGPVPPPPGRAPGGTFTSLRYRNYRLLWFGQASHAAALFMEQIARPWLVLEITGDSAVHVGGVVAMRTAPQLLFGVWAGVLADWFDRKTILLGTKVGVLVLNIVFAAALVTGNIELWHVYAVAFIRGSFMAFDQPARQSLIGSIVPTELVTNAVALMSATQNVMRILGTTASGLVIYLLGVEGAFVIIAVIYFGAVVATAMLRVPRIERDGERSLGGMTRSLVEGAKFAANVPAIRGVLILSVVHFSLGMSWMQVFAALFARNVLDVGEIGFSALVALSAVGALGATYLVATRYPTQLGRLLPVVAMTMGGALVVFALSTYSPGVLGIVLPFLLILPVGAMQTTYMSLANATMITAAPDEMRGRVISLLSLDRAMMTLGAAGAGFLAAAVGVQLAQIIYGGALLTSGAAVFVFAKGFREYRIR